MGALSPLHLLIIGAIVLLIFGNRLPSVMRSLGQGVVEFKKGMQGIEDEMHKGSTSRIEESNKPQAKEEAKPVEAETVQK
jgi:sec-independent protein translocase protein TatA